MSFNNMTTWVATGAALVLVAGTIAHAKGPKGGGHGASSTFTPGAPQAQSTGKSDWSTSPPGWTKAEESKGWDNSTPQGWSQNTLGQEHGWGGGTASPGIQKHSDPPEVDQ